MMQSPRKMLRGPLRLVLVGGAYKSGTSAVCELIEQSGYRNPSSLTGAREHGHGIAKNLYLTRECVVAREFNRRLLHGTPREQSKLEREMSGYLADTSAVLGQLLVLKDPCMKLTATHWLRAARQLGNVEFGLKVTSRDADEVRRSWANSKFMTWKERQQPDLYRQLLAPMPSSVAKELSLGGAAVQSISFEEILRLHERLTARR